MINNIRWCIFKLNNLEKNALNKIEEINIYLEKEKYLK